MMFDLSEKPVVRRPSEEDDLDARGWMTPPGQEMGIYVLVHSPVNVGESGSIHVSGVRAHSSGCLIEVIATVQPGASAYDAIAGNAASVFDPPVREDSSEDPRFIRLGVRYTNGRTATNIVNYRRVFALEETAPALSPVLVQLPRVIANASSEKVIARLDFWLWPSPPPERFELLTEWPGADLSGSAFSLDGELIAEAASKTYKL